LTFPNINNLMLVFLKLFKASITILTFFNSSILPPVIIKKSSLSIPYFFLRLNLILSFLSKLIFFVSAPITSRSIFLSGILYTSFKNLQRNGVTPQNTLTYFDIFFATNRQIILCKIFFEIQLLALFI